MKVKFVSIAAFFGILIAMLFIGCGERELFEPIDVTEVFAPIGWMGDGEQGEKYIRLDEASQEAPHSKPTSIKWTYKKGPVGWAAVAYHYPPDVPNGNWGKEKGFDLNGAKRLTFWARGEKGGESVEFKVGCMLDTKPHKDSLCVERSITLTKDWKQYKLDLAGKDTSSVISGFVWATNQSVTFYLDDLIIE